MELEKIISIKPLFEMLVDQTPGVQRAILHTAAGVAIFAWPTRPVWRASMIAYEAYKITKANEFDQTITVHGLNFRVAKLRRNVLLVTPLNEEICMTLLAEKDYEPRPTVQALSRLVRNLTLIAGLRNELF